MVWDSLCQVENESMPQLFGILINKRNKFRKDLILKRMNVYLLGVEKENIEEVGFPPNQHVNCKISREISSKNNTIINMPKQCNITA